uniref:Uncharacterized protein n=1 Tax=Thermofilum pendens TaxID=2269 RepID=A0A7J3X5J9_THEPE
MRRKGISTALGTVFFIVIASMLLALMLRTYYGFVASMSEITSWKAEQLFEGEPSVVVEYTELRSSTPSAEVLVSSGYSWEGDTLVVHCLNSSESAPGSVDFPAPRIGYVCLVGVSASGDLGSLGNFTLSVNSTAFVEVYEKGRDGAWHLAAKLYPGVYNPVNLNFSGEARVLVYNLDSHTPLSMNISDLKGYSVALAPQARVVVRNAGYAQLEVFSVFVSNSTHAFSVDKHVILAPGESYAFDLGSPLAPGEYVIRVVSRLRVYVVKISLGGARSLGE